MAHLRVRFWLSAAILVTLAFLLRHLFITSGASAAFSEASPPPTTSWGPKLSPAAHSSRPGGWIVPRSRLIPARHTHDFETVAAPVSYSFELIFPQLGNGRVPSTGAGFRTLLTAVNFSNQPARCRLSFFNDAGQPLAVPVNGAAVSALEFELARGQQREFQTSGEGEVQVGWALLESDQPVSGQAVFGLRDRTAAIVTEVGVPAADPGSDFTVLADSLGESQTGIALANSGSDLLRVAADLLDTDGRTVASTQIDLEARGHLAIFLNQLFGDVPGIEEFLGSIRLRSPADFSVMTLRSTGSLLTSLPTVAPPPEDSEPTRLAFPHVADGVQDPLAIATALVLFNNNDLPGNVTLDFFRSDASPMTVEIGGVTASSFDFELQPRGVLKVETRAEGELQAGWARASMNRPLSGSAIFRIFRVAGASAEDASTAGVSRTLETEVGVPSSLLYRDFRILADARGALNTGLAVANVDPDESNVSTSFSIDLRSAEGEFLRRTRMEVPAGGHRALFVDQLFPDQDFDDFTGFLQILKTVGPNVAVVALRSAGAKLTSTPTLTPMNGFAPLIEAAPLQNLAGTQPGFSWMLHQNQDDLALRELTIELDGMGLSDESDLDPGDEIGIGYVAELPESRTFSLVVAETAPDRVDFDTVVPDPDGAVPGGSGRIVETADGLEIRWILTDPEPFSRTPADVDHHFILFPEILEAPGTPANVEIDTELTSVSADPTAARPAVRSIAQPFQFVDPPAGAATLEVVAPALVLPGAPVRFTGSNLGDAPTITFPLQNGETVGVSAYRNVNGIREVQAPTGVAEGLIFADNGTGPGNGYRIFSLFSPVVDFLRVPRSDPSPLGNGVESELMITVRRPGRQLALSRFFGRLSNSELDFQELTPGQPVGTGSVREDPFTTIELAMQVGSVAEDETTIDILQVNQGNAKIAELLLTRISVLDQPSLQLDYRPLTPSLDTVIAGAFSPLELELRLVGLPLSLPAGNLVPARFELLSSPTLTGLAESAQSVIQFSPLLTVEAAP